jgi:pyruvate/2-oxoacid:ferredoxin oxidoreductase beta subunit/NAD-dependent dihydropyrimidine dehydrogenase PreA subunit
MNSIQTLGQEHQSLLEAPYLGLDPFDPLAIDLVDFRDRIVNGYNCGTAEKELDADLSVATSWIPGGTGRLRDFSYIAPELPEFIADKCVGCMECVTECPDTAILAKIIPESELEHYHSMLIGDKVAGLDHTQVIKTTKYYDVPKKKGIEGGYFMLAVDPARCKGCGECVSACGTHDALKMIPKDEALLAHSRTNFGVFDALPATKPEYIQEKVLADMMLSHDALLYTGGAGSCMGCGEATAIRMMLAATGFIYGKKSVGIVASTGCNTVYGSTYPYNPYDVPWTNSLFENSPAVALGMRARWNQLGWNDKKIWVLGGDGAMLDIGFQALSRMLMSGMDIKVLVLDTQVYSNTGGQSSTATFVSQDAKMASNGKVHHGKSERRKELAPIVMMHPDVFVAQTTAAHINHFYRSIIAANEFKGPAVINVYTPCQPEHGIADDMSLHQAKLAVDSRAFPLLTYDPRKGEAIAERISLAGNPATREDWLKSADGTIVDFVNFARTEGRFAKQFDKEGNPTPELMKAQEDRLKNWHLLQELAGYR